MGTARERVGPHRQDGSGAKTTSARPGTPASTVTALQGTAGNRAVGTLLGTTPPAAVQRAGADVAGLSAAEKLHRAWEYAKPHLAPAAARELEALFRPESLAMLAGFATVYALAQLTPAGWVADGVAVTTLAISAIFLGQVAWDVSRDLVTFFGAATATDEAGLQASGAALARAVARGGTALVVALVGRAASGRGGAGPPEGPAPVLVAVTTDGMLVGLSTPAARAALQANPSLLRQLAMMSVATPPPGGEREQDQDGQDTGGEPAGPEQGRGELAARTPAALGLLASVGLDEAMIARFYRGEPVVFTTADDVITIARLRPGQVRVGIFSINIPKDPLAATRAFANVRGLARGLARATGASTYELFGAAVLNSEVEAMLLRRGFVRSSETVPESLGLGAADTIEIMSKTFPVNQAGD